MRGCIFWRLKGTYGDRALTTIVGGRIVEAAAGIVRSSPAEWVECNENNLNERMGNYTCTSEGWVAVSGEIQPSETPKPNVFDLFIQILQKIFLFFKVF